MHASADDVRSLVSTISDRKTVQGGKIGRDTSHALF